jgi:hypothetical protein
MRKQFPLFQTPIDLAHSYWQQCILPGDTVVDATAGNGHDSIVLANLALKNGTGTLHVIDIQKKALENTRDLINEHLDEDDRCNIHMHNSCHSQIDKIIEKNSAKLIVYNLGWLPGSDKKITTLSETTLNSVKASFELIMAGGVISITCYPGHPEGTIEEKKLLDLVRTLKADSWSVLYHRWENRSSSPSLILIQRSR